MSPGPSLRRRLIWILIALVAGTAVLVGALSVVLLDRSLRAQRVDDAVASAEFNLTVLAPAVDLPSDPTTADIEASALLDRFLRRGTDGVWVEVPGGGRLAAAGLVQVEPSPELRALVASGQLGYEFTEASIGAVLVTGGRLPPAGPDFYFVTSTQGVADATRQLVLAVSGAAIAVVAIGALVARGLARTMLRPVEETGRATERMAAGDLDTRLERTGSDEFGRLAASFNTMAESLQSTIAELEDSRARERRFVADVSHELRTPLTGMVNEAALLRDRLKEGSPVTPDDETIATMLDADVRRLRRLVDDLLEISRLELNAPPPPPSLVDLRPFLGALVADRHPDTRLECHVESPIMVEPRGLERIVGNLLDNARHHAAGTETVLAASIGNGTLEVEVADRGPGVAPEMLERIFDRFATADPARGGGTGLGLAIAVQHAHHMGGTLTASNRPGGGLVVTARLPVANLLLDGDGVATSGTEPGGDTSKGDTP